MEKAGSAIRLDAKEKEIVSSSKTETLGAVPGSPARQCWLLFDVGWFHAKRLTVTTKEELLGLLHVEHLRQLGPEEPGGVFVGFDERGREA